jgi:hypothetical protein
MLLNIVHNGARSAIFSFRFALVSNCCCFHKVFFTLQHSAQLMTGQHSAQLLTRQHSALLLTGAKAELGTMMKSVGEVMAMGRTWVESFQKALRGLETGLDGWDLPKNYKKLPKEEVSCSGVQALQRGCKLIKPFCDA